MGKAPLAGLEAGRHTWWSLLELRAAQMPTAVAFHCVGPAWRRQLSFGDWRAAADAASRTMAAWGIVPGDKIGLLAAGSPLWMVLQAACSRLGAVLIPLNSRYRQDELSHIIALTRPALIVFAERIGQADIRQRLEAALAQLDGPVPDLVAVPGPDVALAADAVPAADVDLAADVASAAGGDDADAAQAERSWRRLMSPLVPWPGSLPKVEPSEPVLLQFTSGTTAFPKGALLASGPTLRATAELGRRMGLTSSDVMYSTQPLYHVGGSVATTLMALTVGCAMIVPERYTPTETFRLIRTYRATARTGQAAMYVRELAHPDFDPADFRTLTKGWAGGSPELRRQIVERMGITGLVPVYGLTETAATTTVCAWDDPLDKRLTTTGRALPGLEVAVEVAGAKLTRAAGPGEICVRGWSLMLGYDGDPEATAAAIDADGWLHTGDLGLLDCDGYLVIVDRLKEMIKPGGENVAPAEVERVIAQMDAVVDVAVIGQPDADLGEVPIAIVEPDPQATLTPGDVIDYCVEHMASFKVPRRVEFVTTWPLTPSGKIAKAALKARYGAGGDLGLVGRTG